LCGFVAYAAVDANGRNAAWPAIGYPGPRVDRPAPDEPLLLLKPSTDVLESDVAIVGSGAGGGVAAALFARAGRRVVVLEAGPAADSASLTQLEADAFASLYLDSALTSTEDLGVAILAGSCVGGGTTVNWCTSLRISEKVAEQWSAAAGGIDFGSSLAKHYDAVASRLDVQTTSEHNANNSVLLRGCRALGWHAAESPRNASGCGDGCGYCGFGCVYHHKRSTSATYLRDSVASGAWIVSAATVTRVRIEGGRATGVEAQLSDGRPLRVNAPTVVVAAGSLRTPGILRRSGIGSSHLGRHLRLHPTTAVFAEFEEPIETWRGPMQTIVSNQFGDLDDGYGAKLEAVPAHPGLSALALPWRSQAQHFATMQRARYAAGLIVLTRDRGEGTVSADGKADIHYTLGAYDARHMLTALAGLAEISFAAGARSLLTLHTDPLELTRDRASKANLQAFARELRSRGAAPNRLGVFSAHQMGTCRMHRDSRQGVVDERGAVHGVDGLIVADASVFPLASGVNPMLTIMALAHRSVSSHV
jgi:choline dehydrogenase-like flavoprotein